MEQDLLLLTPTYYRCPYCGEWHPWEPKGFDDEDDDDNWYPSLSYFNDPYYIAELSCPNGNESSTYSFYFGENYFYYSVSGICRKNPLTIEGKIKISLIEELDNQQKILFEDHTATILSSCIEDDCEFLYVCDAFDQISICDSHYIFSSGFKFKKSDYEKVILARKEKESQEHNKKEKDLKPKETVVNEEQIPKHSQVKENKEDTLDPKETAVNEEQIPKQSQVKENKEDTTMANNIFNMNNMEYGPNKDENIASTLMGVAVKNGDTWRIYDKNKKEITDVGDMQLGNLPIFILPTTKLSEGDLIKDDGEYYFVTKVATSKTPTQTLSARTGEMKSVVPIKNVLGFSCYSKVIALSDSLNIGNDFDIEKLAIISAISSQTDENSEQMNQLLPLMLFKDDLGGNDDAVKLMLMSSMMTFGDNSGQMNQLLPLMLFKDDLGGNDDTIKLMLMSSMMGGNVAGSNPMMNYLLLDTFMGKKDNNDNKE